MKHPTGRENAAPTGGGDQPDGVLPLCLTAGQMCCPQLFLSPGAKSIHRPSRVRATSPTKVGAGSFPSEKAPTPALLLKVPRSLQSLFLPVLASPVSACSPQCRVQWPWRGKLLPGGRPVKDSRQRPRCPASSLRFVC